MKHRMRWYSLTGLIWVAGLLFLIWALRRMSIDNIWLILSDLQVWQIGILILVNASILIIFGLRWRLFIESSDKRVSVLSVVSYRIAAFGVNYFTPGPQFGGEPLQVALLTKRHNISGVSATTSVALDKLLEISANLGFLVWGLVLIFSQRMIDELAKPGATSILALLLILPLIYLGLIWRGIYPLSTISKHISSKMRSNKYINVLVDFVTASEHQASSFCQKNPKLFLEAVLLSLLGWILTIFEFWISLHFLGMPTNLLQTIAILTAARLAFLAPTPGGLGALEAALLLATSALGYGAATGISLAFLIRARDLILGGLGLLIAGRLAPALYKPPVKDIMV